MGIQAFAEAKDLVSAGFVEEVLREETLLQNYDGYDEYVVREEHYWVSPRGKRMFSYVPHGLCFDNRSANMDYVEELKAFGVSYTRG